jgi:hypothetical protein
MKPTEYNFPSVVRHVYDIDAFEIIDKLTDKYKVYNDQVTENHRDLEFIKLEEDILIEFLNEEGFDTLSHQEHRNFIVPSYYNFYNSYLGYKLLTIDLYKIEPLLSYQSVLFLGNYYAASDNFLGLIEYLVYDFVKARLLPFEQIRLEKIVNWIERNRVFMINKAYDKSSARINYESEEKDFSESQNADVKIEFQSMETNVRIVKMDAQFAKILSEKLSCFFESQEILLYNLIFKNEFTAPLVFNGQDNQLAELFKRLRYNGLIDVKSYNVLAHWIYDCFSTIGNNGKTKKLVLGTIKGVLKNSEREPPKSKRILIELAKYIMPDDRK